jgi:L-ascorbate metabolism protein UlaG (beta-lactamase superfamily)
MEPKMAAKAAKAVRAKAVVPHHFGTFPILTQDTTGFATAVKKSGIQFIQMKPGDTLTYKGKELVK